MKFNQRIGGTFHRSFFAEGAQQATHQCGLAAAEVAFKPDNHAGRNHVRQRRAQRQRGCLILEL